jgi:hypothetical protein
MMMPAAAFFLASSIKCTAGSVFASVTFSPGPSTLYLGKVVQVFEQDGRGFPGLLGGHSDTMPESDIALDSFGCLAG